MSVRCSMLVAAALLGWPGLALAQGAKRTPPVARIADRTLTDVAVAVSDGPRPVIYFNPLLMEELGPELAAFFLGHEYGHIDARHHRAAWFERQGLEPSEVDQRLRDQELEADCFAARTVGAARRPAVLAAIAFFDKQGSNTFDSRHPTGIERVTIILQCMPAFTAQDAEEIAPILQGWHRGGE